MSQEQSKVKNKNDINNPNFNNFSLEDMIQLRNKKLEERVHIFNEYANWEMSKGNVLYMREISTPAEREIMAKDPYTNEVKKMLMFGSNNYLGFANHPYIKEKVKETIEKYGTGLGGPPILSGTTSLHVELESKLAKLKNKEAAMIFSSGYNCNVGWVSALINKKDIVLFDQYCHASFIDGLKMNQIKPRSFRHNDIDNLKAKLEKFSKEKDENCDIFVVTEGVFSMDGDVCKLDEILKLKKQYNFFLVVDDAHGFGVIGEHGHGVQELFHTNEIDLIMGTFSKAFATTGGFLVSSKGIVQYVRWIARSYMFSASLSPIVIASVLASIELLDKENWRVKNLKNNVKYLVELLEKNNIHVAPESSLVCVLVSEGINIRDAGKKMHDMGIFVNTVEFPAVPKNMQRFRISVMTDHTKEDIEYLVECLIKVMK